MPKVLIITYYWPPAGGSGVQRWLKMVKYMAHTHWEPLIYTAKEPEAPIVDGSLAVDVPTNIRVLRRWSFEPFRLFQFLTGSKSNMGAGFASSDGKRKSGLWRLALWIRGNMFIPDARAFWIRPSIRHLSQFLKEHPVDMIITTGPPHSMHLIGLGLKLKKGVRWIADFRDPWVNIDYASDLMLTKRSQRRHQKMERKVIQQADAVVAISQQMANEFEFHKPNRLLVIPNGFDEDDFKSKTIDPPSKLILTHVGTIPPNRNNSLLWEAIARAIENRPQLANNFKIVFVGKIDASVVNAVNASGISHLCQFEEYVPHDRAIDFMLNSSVLLILVNNSPNSMGIVPGKLFEYMAANRPILAFGPKGSDLETILEKTGTGKVFQFDQSHQVEAGLNWIIEMHQTGFDTYIPQGVQTYSRRSQSLQYIELMDSLLSQ